MEDADLRELIVMCDEALEAIKQHETTGSVNDVFNKIRSVGSGCLDGDKLNSGIM